MQKPIPEKQFCTFPEIRFGIPSGATDSVRERIDDDLCNICDPQAVSEHKLKELVNGWAEQWELVVDDLLDIGESPADVSALLSQEPFEAPEASAGCTRSLFHREAGDIARRFCRLSDRFDVDDIFKNIFIISLHL